MQPRKIANIAENDVVEFNESVNIQGSIGKNAKVTIKSGNLKVDGAVESGANIDVQHGSASIQTVNGPDTRIRASEKINVKFKNGDVKLNSPMTAVLFMDCNDDNIKGTIKMNGVTLFQDGVRTLNNHVPDMIHISSLRKSN